jgi:uridine kinase
LSELLVRERLLQLPRRRETLLVGIDGRGASGKSTLAEALARLSQDTTVVQVDDFYRSESEREARRQRGDREIGDAFDLRRLLDQVIRPLSVDEPATFQRYDWDSDQLAEWKIVEPGGIVVIEGNYSTRAGLREFYDFTIWVDAPHDVRLQRGVERDGEAARQRWLHEWMPEEDRYIASERPSESCDLVVDGGGTP